jgi:outer membrane usher protein FimD/PapC
MGSNWKYCHLFELGWEQTRKVEEVSARSTPLTPVVTHPSSRVKRLSQSLNKMQSGNLELETTRVLPSTTLEAHELAKISVSDMIGDRMSAIKTTLTRQETQRRASTRRSVSFQKSIPLDEMSVADQFVDLSVDIAEQRKELKRNQQERFDEMWG